MPSLNAYNHTLSSNRGSHGRRPRPPATEDSPSKNADRSIFPVRYQIARALCSLPQTAHLVQGPVDKHGFAVDVFPFDKPPGAAVAGGHAVVAQDEIAVARHLLGSPRN